MTEYTQQLPGPPHTKIMEVTDYTEGQYAVGHSMTRGKREFSSARALKASRYEVLVPTPRVEEARRILGL